MDTNIENKVGASQPEVVVVKQPARRKPRKRRVKVEQSAPSVSAVTDDALEDSKLATFTNIATNLALLAAIFVIIFAAHHGIQQSRKAAVTSTPVAQTEEVIKEEIREIVQEEVQKAKAEENAADVEEAVAEVIAEEKVEQKIEEPVQPKKAPERTSPVVKRAYVDRTDPYTNGGPLDLDRRDNAARATRTESSAKVTTAPVAVNTPPPAPNSRGIEQDKNNPWNSGGNLDLDHEEQRIKYQKSLTLTDSNDLQGKH